MFDHFLLNFGPIWDHYYRLKSFKDPYTTVPHTHRKFQIHCEPATQTGRGSLQASRPAGTSPTAPPACLSRAATCDDALGAAAVQRFVLKRYWDLQAAMLEEEALEFVALLDIEAWSAGHPERGVAKGVLCPFFVPAVSCDQLCRLLFEGHTSQQVVHARRDALSGILVERAFRRGDKQE